jgi:1-acyl-sn-glycerol-3-phosphate acyltransferase
MPPLDPAVEEKGIASINGSLPDLPPISNRPLYIYRILGKWLSFFVFGLFMGILGIPVFALMRIILKPKKRFNKYARSFVSFCMRCFIGIMHFLGVVDLEVSRNAAFRCLTSKIIVANHPSLLDVVMLLSLVPNADCIVNAYLGRNILTGVVLQLYILSSRDFDDILKTCDESLKQGNCLIIFPEGTRTPRAGKPVVRKGAARIALACGCDVVPVHIGGNDKYGLGKKDPWTGFNPNEPYVYRISMENEICMEKYYCLPRPAAVRVLTHDIAKVIFPQTGL